MYDVIIVGAGVCGTSLARELSKYRLSVCCLERENDVADGTTKANSGIVHAGYDPLPGTQMAKLNVVGNAMVEQLCKDLDVPYRKNGSLVLAFDDDEMKTIQTLYERGVANGVPDLSILSGEEVAKLEPNLNPVKGALYAKSAGVVSPWELAIAQMEVAVQNGVELYLEREVNGITWNGESFAVTAVHNGETESYEARYLVNAAGVDADTIESFINEPPYHTKPNKGQYYLLDKSQGELVHTVVFQCPSKLGKGVLVSPTAHGNLIVGPDSVDQPDKDDVSVTADRLAFIRNAAARSCSKINYRDSIRNFAGIRAQSEQDEFLIHYSPVTNQMVHLANIKSPGLTSSPAIALEVVEMLQKAGLVLEEKDSYQTTRRFPRFRELSEEEKKRIIEKDPRYGRIICRCESITEGEIVAAVHSPVPATTVDAVKRRCNAGMGRCQGGFCSPRVVEIIARELHRAPESICKDKAGSYILIGKTTKGEEKA